MTLKELSAEHQLNRMIFDGVSVYMDTADLPKQASADQATPVPYIGKIGNVTVAFIGLFRRTRTESGVGLVIQYTVKIGDIVVASLVRNVADPLYGMLHFRREFLNEVTKHLKKVINWPMEFREMTRSEAETFAVEDNNMAKKQIRILPP